MQTRVRFAPSPTGFLHVGGARTALFNWLFARSTGGKFLLRIEDTDRERSDPKYTADILESLSWLGLNWDEPPVYQSSRFDRYATVANELMAAHLAYRCDCKPEVLDAIRQRCQKEKRPFRYPGTCREKKEIAAPYVVRIKVPKEGATAFKDLIRGDISFQNKDLDDWVILRTDGSPTYNFSVVIDDHDQGITHVLRGDDHINNTPKQILLYQALGFEVPNFAHLPMILGTDRTKLSKRHGAASTLEYRTMGYLPQALVNFLVRLGWSYGDQEIFTVEELKRFFSLERVGKANAVFNPEKLEWISGIFMRDTPSAELASYLDQYFAVEMAFTKDVERERLEKGIAITQGKIKKIPELIAQLKCLFGEDPAYEQAGLKAEDAKKMFQVLTAVKDAVGSVSAFSKDDLDQRVRAVAAQFNEKLAPVAQAIRFAVTGGKVSPGLFEMLEVQGKQTVLRRVENAIRWLGELGGSKG
ncbi:MAG: glutamate--tRNA ligase [Deltaproteobacteria bacterium]|nr:glutamate--tRNA ligase [Deltaproteobacteria bacterium]